MLLREAILDKKLKAYSTIILDEAHERTVNSDVLLALLKGIAKERSDLKIVVMSATLDLAKFKAYFESEATVEVEGRTYPIEVFNTRQP
jgi:pre-mRNA-splicing factor ATP-dependent RNA helicase DHX15/PRP43